MNLYQVTEVDLVAVVNTAPWHAALRCIAMLFAPLPMSASDWREDPELYQEIGSMNNEEKYQLFCQHPLSFFSMIDPGDDPLYLQARLIRLEILDRAVDPYCPEWWTYLHYCETAAVFIGLTLMTLLYPEQRFYMASNTTHVVVVNQAGADLILSSDSPFATNSNGKYSCTRDITHPLFIDLVEQCVDIPFTLLTMDQDFVLVPAEEAAAWYNKTYMAYVGNENDIPLVENWHQQLFGEQISLPPYRRAEISPLLFDKEESEQDYLH